MKSPKMPTDSGLKQQLDAGAGAVLRPIISKAVHGNREKVAAQLTIKSGRDITVAMLNDWCAPTKPRARFPADLVALFCEVTGDDRLQRAILSPRHRVLLELGEFVLRLLEERIL